MTDPTPTDEQQDVREAYAALQRLFDAAKPSVANRRAGKDAMMRDVQTVTRALAARPAPVVSGEASSVVHLTMSAEQVANLAHKILTELADNAEAARLHPQRVSAVRIAADVVRVELIDRIAALGITVADAPAADDEGARA